MQLQCEWKFTFPPWQQVLYFFLRCVCLFGQIVSIFEKKVSSEDQPFVSRHSLDAVRPNVPQGSHRHKRRRRRLRPGDPLWREVRRGRRSAFLLTFIEVLSKICSGHPDGAPVEACATLLPRHAGVSTEDGAEGPYVLEVENQRPQSSKMKITLRLRDPGTFKGIYVLSWGKEEARKSLFVSPRIFPSGPRRVRLRVSRGPVSGGQGRLLGQTLPR